MKQFLIFDITGLYSGRISQPAEFLPLIMPTTRAVESEIDPAKGVYLDLKDYSVREYTAEENWELSNLKEGWVWKMPERIAVDTRTTETELAAIRNKRNQLLIASDWTQLPDVPLAIRTAWATYRQALRDVTLQPDPFNITWPISP
jgi:hypothetical protein